MKLTKIITILMLAIFTTSIASIDINAKKKSYKKAKAHKTIVAQFNDDDELVRFYSDGTYDIKGPEYVHDKGYWKYLDEIYLFVSENFGRSWIVFGDKRYDLDGLAQGEDSMDRNLLPNIFLINGGETKEVLRDGKFSFNPETQQLNYQYQDEKGSFKLSQIPDLFISPIYWNTNF